MTATTLKTELHNAIESINDKNVLEAVYTLINKHTHEYIINKDQQKELNKRLQLLKEGILKSKPYKKALKEIRTKLAK